MDGVTTNGTTDRAGIVVQAQTCWQRIRTNRVTLLVDGEAYFTAFARAVQGARRSVMILGWDWDIESRVRLFRGGLIPGFRPGSRRS